MRTVRWPRLGQGDGSVGFIALGARIPRRRGVGHAPIDGAGIAGARFTSGRTIHLHLTGGTPNPTAKSSARRTAYLTLPVWVNCSSSGLQIQKRSTRSCTKRYSAKDAKEVGHPMRQSDVDCRSRSPFPRPGVANPGSGRVHAVMAHASSHGRNCNREANWLQEHEDWMRQNRQRWRRWSDDHG